MAKVYDILVVGGGIAGLWAAKRAAEAGFSVLLAEKGACGEGASGGPLGALIPHLPNTTSEKRRFQWSALDELSGLIAELEDETGLATGYKRCGRVTPVRRENFLERAQQSVLGSRSHWNFGPRTYEVTYLDPAAAEDLLPPETAPFGAIYETMAAKVVPRQYTAALAASISRRAEIRTHCEIHSWDAQTSTAQTADRDRIVAQRIVIAAGAASFPMLAALTGGDYGHGVKGQAALFEHDAFEHAEEDRPIIYDDGVYVVTHGGTCAVGSTSERDFEDPDSTSEAQLQPITRRARSLMPSLSTAKPVSYWAGVRPRAAAKDPLVGCLEPDQRIYAITGGFKISFGISHRMASALVDQLLTSPDTTGLPMTYHADHHIAQMTLTAGLNELSRRTRLP